jgi:RNA polymerase sigma-70 factor (ECF subfamily)
MTWPDASMSSRPPRPCRKPGIAGPPNSSVSGLTPNGRRILGAIERLPEDEREIFDLVRIQGLTHGEAAAVVGVSEKTVQRRLSRARFLLAEQLADLRPATPSAATPPGDNSTP